MQCKVCDHPVPPPMKPDHPQLKLCTACFFWGWDILRPAMRPEFNPDCLERLGPDAHVAMLP